MTYEERMENIFNEIKANFVSAIATVSKKGEPSVRVVSFIRIGENLFFQTDKTMGKAIDIENNHLVAICIEGVQIKGKCYEVGTVSDNPDFEDEYRNAFPSAYKKYSHLENERVYKVSPEIIICWSYIDNKPCYEIFDVKRHTYIVQEY